MNTLKIDFNVINMKGAEIHYCHFLHMRTTDLTEQFEIMFDIFNRSTFIKLNKVELIVNPADKSDSD